MKPTMTAAALALVSVMEFLSAYPVNAETNGHTLSVEKNGESVSIPLADSQNVIGGEVYLEKLFTFLDSQNTESVLADWNLHAERETHILSVVNFVMPGSEEWSEREAAILAANETRPVGE